MSSDRSLPASRGYGSCASASRRLFIVIGPGSERRPPRVAEQDCDGRRVPLIEIPASHETGAHDTTPVSPNSLTPLTAAAIVTTAAVRTCMRRSAMYGRLPTFLRRPLCVEITFRRLPGKRSGAVSGAEERPTTSHYQLAEVRRVPESVTHLAWHYVASLMAFCECIISSQMFTDAQLQQP